MKIYLDNAATTAVDPSVLEVMLPWLQGSYGNPSSIHAKGRESRAAIEKARKTVASYLNTSTSEIFFTSGGTESNNFILQNAISHLGITDVITSRIEHHCVLHTLEHLEKQHEITTHYVDLLDNGHISIDSLRSLLESIEGSVLVSLMYVNNEIGNILDVEAVGELCKSHSALFHTDAVQAIAHQKIDLQKLNIDFLCGSAHKFHGPKGVGFMYCKADYQVKPAIFGGSQERNTRAGTENVPGIVGLSAALSLAYEHLDEEYRYIKGLKDYLIEQVEEFFPEADFVGDYNGNSQYTILNISFENYPNSSLLLLNLDVFGICVSGGSACSSGVDAGSHVLNALNSEKQFKESIRFSFSKTNTKEEIDILIGYLNTHLKTNIAAEMQH